MHNSPSDWGIWKRFFHSRADRPLPALGNSADCSSLPASLAKSLAIFQLGESGGGTVVQQAKSSRLPGIDEDYVEALDLFVREEHRHANILAMCVRMLNGTLIRKNWTARLFVFARRLMGLRLKILVLLAAEVVGICYYRSIAEKLPDGRIRGHLLELAQDENAHLVFHCDFLRAQTTNAIHQWLFVAVWRSVMFAAEIAVLIDHRQALRDLDIGLRELRALWHEHSRHAEHLVVDPAGGLDRSVGVASHIPASSRM